MYDLFIYILSFVFIITIPVFLHELGHFIAAKSVGIKVEKFYIGFNLFGLGIKRKFRGTEYGIGLFPLGGYVKVSGIIDESLDNNSEKETKNLEIKKSDPNSEFRNKNTFQKLWFLSAGVMMNFLLTIIIYFFTFYSSGIVEPIHQPIVKHIQEDLQIIDNNWNPKIINGPAYSGNLTPLSKIVEVNQWDENNNIIESYEINSWETLLNVIQKIGSDKLISLIFLKSEEFIEIEQHFLNLKLLNAFEYNSLISIYDYTKFTWQPRESSSSKFMIIDQVEGTDLLGSNALIGISGYSKHRELGIFESLSNASINTLGIIKLTSNSLKGLVIGDIPISQLSGIVGIGQIAGDTAKSNSKPILALIGLMAFISANLGFINILPIPGLDGGHAAIAIVEGLRRKELSAKTKLRIQMVGMIFIFLLFGFTIFNDLFKIFS